MSGTKYVINQKVIDHLDELAILKAMEVLSLDLNTDSFKSRLSNLFSTFNSELEAEGALVEIKFLEEYLKENNYVKQKPSGEEHGEIQSPEDV